QQTHPKAVGEPKPQSAVRQYKAIWLPKTRHLPILRMVVAEPEKARRPAATQRRPLNKAVGAKTGSHTRLRLSSVITATKSAEPIIDQTIGKLVPPILTG